MFVCCESHYKQFPLLNPEFFFSFLDKGISYLSVIKKKKLLKYYKETNGRQVYYFYDNLKLWGNAAAATQENATAHCSAQTLTCLILRR